MGVLSRRAHNVAAMIACRPFPRADRRSRALGRVPGPSWRFRTGGRGCDDLREEKGGGRSSLLCCGPVGTIHPYTHFGKDFELIDGRFAICRPPPESLVGRRHENEENASVIGNLPGGMAEARAGSGGTSTGTKAFFRSRDDAPLAAAANSARQRWRRAWRLTSQLLSYLYGETQCAPPDSQDLPSALRAGNLFCKVLVLEFDTKLWIDRS